MMWQDPAVCHFMHLAVLYAVLRPLSLSLQLCDFPGCEVYQYQSRQYFLK